MLCIAAVEPPPFIVLNVCIPLDVNYSQLLNKQDTHCCDAFARISVSPAFRYQTLFLSPYDIEHTAVVVARMFYIYLGLN